MILGFAVLHWQKWLFKYTHASFLIFINTLTKFGTFLYTHVTRFWYLSTTRIIFAYSLYTRLCRFTLFISHFGFLFLSWQESVGACVFRNFIPILPADIMVTMIFVFPLSFRGTSTVYLLTYNRNRYVSGTWFTSVCGQKIGLTPGR